MKKIHKAILELLGKKGPMTTNQIKKELGCSWSAVYIALVELKMLGKVKRKDGSKGFRKEWVWEVVK